MRTMLPVMFAREIIRLDPQISFAHAINAVDQGINPRGCVTYFTVDGDVVHSEGLEPCAACQQRVVKP